MAKSRSTFFEETQAKQRAYWERRANTRINESIRSDAAIDAATREAYAAVKAKLDSDIKGFYSKYASNGEMTLATALTRLSPAEKRDHAKRIETHKGDIKSMLQDESFRGNKRLQAHLRHIELMRPTAAVTRRQALIDEIDHNVTMLTAHSESRLATIMYDRYEDGFKSTIQGLNRYDSRIGALLGSPAPAQIEKATQEQWMGSDFSDRLWKDKKKLITNVRSHLTQSFVQGLGADANARLLAKDLDSSFYNAARVFRTESSFISETATFDAYEAAHITEYTFMCALDEITCDICGALHLKKFKIRDAVVGINKAPLHPHCRCTSGAHIEPGDFDWIDKLIREG